MDKPKQTYSSLNDFINKTRKLLTQQQQAEKENFDSMTSSKSVVQIEEEGAGLSNMIVVSSKQGFYDKIIITLTKNYHSEKNRIQIPQHCKLQVGDDVAIFHGDKMIADGIVYRRTSQKLKVSISIDPEDNQDFEDMKVNIILKWNEVTYRRYFQILDLLQNPHENIPLSHLFFNQSARGYQPKPIQKGQYQKMNQQQCIAINNGLVQQCHLIHGPPGTGKTTTVCELIAQAVKKGQKVLACAPSNIAVDNIVEGISHRVNCVRVGNPARMLNDIIERCLDFLVSKSENLWKKQEKQLNAAQKKLKRTKVKSERKEIYGQIKQIRTQLHNLQQQVISQVLNDADVICCTNVGAADKVFKKYLGKKKFDLVIIDQCGQGLEVSCWIPLSKANKVVLAGDHKQLPPTVKFQQDSLLSYTLFSRCMQQLTYLTSTMLEVQYRMNKVIMGWSNAQFYNNRLMAHKSVENHTLRQIYNAVDEQQSTLLFIDTAGCQVGQEGGEMESKMNTGQADIVTHVYKKLLKFGVRNKDIAILTPYSKQVTLIKNILAQHQCQSPEVSTVDGIQGRQKQCIIISLVRSNPNKQIGFLKDWRRMNVAITRARRMLIVIGDSDCISVDAKIKSLLQWINQNGNVQSAEELKEDPSIRFGLGKIVQKFHNQTQKKDQVIKKEKKNKKDKGKTQKQKPNQNQQAKKQEIKNKKQHTMEQQQDLKTQYRTALYALSKEIIFDNLNAYQRKMMHEVAQQYGYDHMTSEDKSKITIRPSSQIKKQQQEKERQLKKKKQEAKKQKKNRNKQKKPQNLKQLIGDQSSQQQVESQRNLSKEQAQENQIEQVEQKPKVGKKKNKKAKMEKQKEQQDWDKILDQFVADLPKNNQCYKCKKTITSVTSIQCRFCNYNFCRHDVLAQEHGCQQLARQHAKRGNLDKYLEQGAKKIKQKLKQQEDQRRKKVKQNKDKKK